MRTYSTGEAAVKLKLNRITLQRYIAHGKLINIPALKRVGGARYREWTTNDIEQVRKQLPKIKNGRRRRKKK